MIRAATHRIEAGIKKTGITVEKIPLTTAISTTWRRC
jgi:hypothetical protein